MMGLPELVIILLVVVIGALRHPLARRFRRPVTIPTCVTIVLLTFFARFFAISGRLIAIEDFHIQLKIALQALGIGISIDLIARELRIMRSVQAGSSVR